MAHLFIGGNPVSGKTTLAREIITHTGGTLLNLDRFRSEMREEESLRYWTDFFLNQAEWAYWQDHTFAQHWDNMKRRAEAYWPFLRPKIQESIDESPSVIVEAGTLMPIQLAELNFSGVYLIGTDQETIYRRLRDAPRWGTCSSLQRMEAAMYAQEGEMLRSEAEKYGFPVFEDAQEALAALVTTT